MGKHLIEVSDKCWKLLKHYAVAKNLTISKAFEEIVLITLSKIEKIDEEINKIE